MNAITNQFAAKTSISALDKYRHHMRDMSRIICNCLMKSQVDSRFAGDDPGYLATGSNAEGASLARQFSDDVGTSGEAEIDIMVVLFMCKTEACMSYVDKNNAFVHIKGDPSAMEELTPVYGEEAVLKALCRKEDGCYLNGYSIKDILKQQMDKSPNMYKNMCYYPYSAEKKCDAKSASFELCIDFDEGVRQQCASNEQAANPAQEVSTTSASAVEASRQMAEKLAGVNANADQKFAEFIKQVKPVCVEFEGKIEGMLSHLEAVQKQFMGMRSAEVAVPLGIQAAKVLEWTTTCVDITDYIFATRGSTIYRTMQETCGMTAEMMDGGTYEVFKRKLKFCIDQLMISEEDLADPSVAATVGNFLSDMEQITIGQSRFLIAYRELVRHQTMYSKMIYFVDENPQLNQIHAGLRPVGSTVNKLSMDIVPCLELMFWPSVACEWKTRDRMWPSQLVVEEIVSKGTHLVAKGYCHDDIDWRLSFSGAEIDLATRWSPAQHFVYFIFKALFYKYIKPIGDLKTSEASSNISGKKFVASYMAKTVMMWTSESFRQWWWTENDAPECLTVLLLALQSAFECRTLTHYFISSVNLLEGVPDEVVHHVTDTIQSVLADPRAVAHQLGCHFEKAQIFLDATDAQRAEMDSLLSRMREFGFSW